MNLSFYSAAVGADAQQTRINVISNNIANSNTNGHRARQAGFADLLYSNMLPDEGGQQAVVSKTGSGSRVETVGVSYAQGTTQVTNSPLDYAIIGEGFFAVQNPQNGEISYTRNGNFKASLFGDNKFYLTTPDGQNVLDTNGKNIEITFPVDKSGEDYIDDFAEEEYDADGNLIKPKIEAKGPYDPRSSYDIGIYDFKSKEGMTVVANERFTPTAKNGAPFLQNNSSLKRGQLELSNIDLSREFTRLIESQRAFQYALKMVKTSDEIEETFNALR